MLKPVFNSAFVAQMTICKRAHIGLIRARAERFIADKRESTDFDIPKGFWWAEGHEALHQNWPVGDFDTWINNGRLHLQAFGVSFLRTDVEKIIPTDKRVSAAPVGVLTPVTQNLEKYLLEVHDSNKARFVEEAITCMKNNSYRAAIVLTWVGALFLLYNYVVMQKLSAFNTEMTRRFPKNKPVRTIDDLAQAVKEAEFLSILEHIKAITKAENKELTGCPDRRNTAGHPNSHTFTEVNVGHHVETLILTVYQRF